MESAQQPQNDMALSENYRDLIVEARDAIFDLLAASSPDAWLELRWQYGELGRALAVDDEACRGDHNRESATARREDGEWGRAAWLQTPRERREDLVLSALGDQRLAVSELATRVDARVRRELALLEPSVDRVVYDSDMRHLLSRMWHDGKLDRVEEKFERGIRYRYGRHRRLEGPIADLERTFTASEGAP